MLHRKIRGTGLLIGVCFVALETREKAASIIQWQKQPGKPATVFGFSLTSATTFARGARMQAISRHADGETKDYADYVSARSEWETTPLFTESDFEDAVHETSEGHPHGRTLIYLHAFGCCGKMYVQPLLQKMSAGLSLPWAGNGCIDPALRVVLPTARLLQLPWGPVEPSWYGYASAESNSVGDASSVLATRKRLAGILRSEIARLGGRADCVFLGGLSQGCTAALDAYLLEGAALGLGGFVGSVGFWPSDAQGFPGADEATRRLIADTDQGGRPIWLQSALDDEWVSWVDVVQPSLRVVRGNAGLPQLRIKTVAGQKHDIGQLEGDWLHEFWSTFALQ